jgi:hypothetical protein
MKSFSLLLIGLFFATAQPEGVVTSLLADTLLSAEGSAIAFDTLAGDLPGIVAAQSKPYLVAGDIYVPQGKTVMIEAGVVFLFKNFTGLHVSGILLARGTKDKPIIFTSENDRDYHRKSVVDPAPFDWNGLYLHEDAVGTHLAYCAILYSVDGIVSQTKFIRLNTCLFLHNGRASLTVEGKQHSVTNQPYDYSLSVSDLSLMKIPANILKDPQATSRMILRYSGIVTSIAGLVMAMIGGSNLNMSSHEFNSMSATTDENLAHQSSSSWNSARLKKNKDSAALFAGCGIAIVGGIGIGWSFTF